MFRSLEREECEQKMSELSRQEPIKASEVQDIISKVKSEVMIKVNSKLKSLEETHKQEVSEMKKVSRHYQLYNVTLIHFCLGL